MPDENSYFNFQPIKGNGVYLYDKDGYKVLDFAGGNFGNNILGYSNPVVEKCIINNLHSGILSQNNVFLNDEKENLTKKLCSLAGFTDEYLNANGSVLFSNSSSEANENAIKIVRNRYNKLCDRDYSEIICFKNCFHGNTIATISANGNDDEINEIDPSLQGFQLAEFNNIKSVDSLITEDTSAVIIEPVQFSNGIEVCDYSFLKELRELCTYHKIGLIIDETTCGGGKVGSILAIQDYNIKPDIITIGSSFACGMSFSATIICKDFSPFIVQNRYTDFQQNTLFYSLVNNIIEEIDTSTFLQQVEKNGELLKTKLEFLQKQYNNILQSVSGFGLMISVKIRDEIPAKRFAKLLLSNGLCLSLLQDNKIGIFPPLIISNEDIQIAYDIILSTIEELSIIERY